MEIGGDTATLYIQLERLQLKQVFKRLFEVALKYLKGKVSVYEMPKQNMMCKATQGKVGFMIKGKLLKKRFEQNYIINVLSRIAETDKEQI